MRSLLLALSGASAIALAGTAHAQPMSEAEAAALRERVAKLEARLAELEQRIAEAPPAQTPPVVAAAPPATAPVPAAPATGKVEWKGSPRFVDGDRAFKAKGRIQADANYVSTPDGLPDRGLGFSNEFRRIRLGGEGELGSGFGYKLELELSDNSVDLVDTFVTWRKGPLLVMLGNHNAFQSLDELIGDTGGSVMERAAFTDAFNFERRLGISAQYRKGIMLAQFGVFTDDISALANSSDGPNGGDENNSFSIDGRLVAAPKIGGMQLHLAGSGHWRQLNRLSDAGVRYRQRPYVHSSNSRLIGTPQMRADEEFSYGAELAMVSGRWHAAAEGHWMRTSRIGAPNVTFGGGYAEVGYYLTDDTRPYDNGIFSTAKPKTPFGKGGIGAVQMNLRYDYLDLNDQDIRGGTQDAYIVALVWTPIQYLRFNLNYARVEYGGATPLPDGRVNYGIDVIGSRFELDF